GLVKNLDLDTRRRLTDGALQVVDNYCWCVSRWAEMLIGQAQRRGILLHLFLLCIEPLFKPAYSVCFCQCAAKKQARPKIPEQKTAYRKVHRCSHRHASTAVATSKGWPEIGRELSQSWIQARYLGQAHTDEDLC